MAFKHIQSQYKNNLLVTQHNLWNKLRITSPFNIKFTNKVRTYKILVQTCNITSKIEYFIK